MPRWESRSGRFALSVLSIGVALPVLWVVVERVLRVDQGLDLTDEGFYLVAADPPNLGAAWLFPFGWHTRPMFALVGWDIASFRTLGGVLLIIIAVTLGWVSGRLVVSPSRTVAARCYTVTASAVAGIGITVYYTSMLRVPSYNWLGLVGICMVLIGVCLILMQRASSASWLASVPAGLLTSVGMFLTIPAKPSTPPLMLLVGVSLIWYVKDFRSAWRWVVLTVAGLPVLLGVVLVCGIWPTDFANVFRLALQMPTPNPSQTLLGALPQLLTVPRDLLSGFAAVSDRAFPLLVLSATGLLLAAARKRRWLVLRLSALTGAGIAALAIAGLPIPVVNPTAMPLGLAQPSTTTSLAVVLGAAALARWRLMPTDSDRDVEWSRRVRTGLVGAMVVSTIVFAFGSDNGVFGQASLAGGLLLLAAALVTGGLPISRDTMVITLVVGLVCSALVFAGIIGGWRFPQRSAALDLQTSVTTVGNRGAELALDSATSSTIRGLRREGDRLGWKPGEPLVDVSYTWHPGMVYALGGRAPQSLQLTIFGYGATHDITDFHLSSPFLDYPFSKAWLLTSDPSTLDASAVDAANFTLEKLAAVSGNWIPEDYACVKSGDFVLWRPADADVGESHSCVGYARAVGEMR